jgi:hypothetical protein
MCVNGGDCLYLCKRLAPTSSVGQKVDVVSCELKRGYGGVVFETSDAGVQQIVLVAQLLFRKNCVAAEMAPIPLVLSRAVFQRKRTLGHGGVPHRAHA